MSLVYKDRVKQSVSATGQGALTIGSPVLTYNTFDNAGLSNNTFPYAILNTTQYEIGLGTYGSGILYRNLVLSNSNSDNNFVYFDGTIAYAYITNAAEISVLVSSQPFQNTFKNLKWLSNQYTLVDPVLNAPSLAGSINSSLMFYNANTTDYMADANLQFYPGNTPELYLNGVFQAKAKSFKISHPLKEGKYLMHGCLEGPEFGIYHRNSIKIHYIKKIKLPDYFLALCDEYDVFITCDSFIPCKVIKKQLYFYVKLLIPSLISINVKFLIIGSRNDIKFELEK